MIIYSSGGTSEIVAVGFNILLSGKSAAGIAENVNNDGKSFSVDGEPCDQSLVFDVSSAIDSVGETYPVKSKHREKRNRIT